MKRSSTARLFTAAAGSVALLAFSPETFADSTWQGGGGNNFMETPGNWDNGVPTGAIAIFPSISAVATPSADTGVSFLGMVINNSGAAWTIDRSGTNTNARSITLGSAGVTATGTGNITWQAVTTVINAAQDWNIASGVNLNISQNITFASKLTKTGQGTLFTSAVGSGAGGVDIMGGVFATNRSTLVVGSGAINVFNGGTFEARASVGGAPITLQNGARLAGLGASGLANTSSVTLSGNGTTVSFGTTNTSDNFSIGTPVIGGDNTNVIEISGPGTVSMTGGTTSALSFAGKWLVKSGTLKLVDLNGLGNRGGNNGASSNNVSNATLVHLDGGTYNAAGSNAGSTAVTLNNSFLVTSDSSLVGDRASTSGTLLSGFPSSGGARQFGAMTINGSTLNVSLGSLVTGASAGSPIRMTTTALRLTEGTATFNVMNPSFATLQFETVSISDGGLGLGFIKTGNGTMSVTGVSTYTGPTTVNGGTLTFSQVGGTSTTRFTLNNASTVSFGAGAASQSWAIKNNIAGNGVLSVSANTNSTINAQGMTISPGTTSTSGSLTLRANGSGIKSAQFTSNGTTLTTFEMNVSGANAVAGTDHDQVVLSATSLTGNLSSANLVLTVDPSLDADDFIDGQVMTLISAPGLNFSGMSFANVSYTSGAWAAIDNIYYNNGSVVLQLPEPSCLTMLGAGALGLLARRRRK